ncbi:MAG: glycosyltransferase, partial [Chloroflexi bacterium]|nr:glycosyltransferase [Chloroflexota bacterium]
MTISAEGFRVLKIAPTPFFDDYGCHVRILEETLALQALGSQVTICTYHTGHDLPGLDIRRALYVPWKNGLQPGSSMHKPYFDALLSLRSLQSSITRRPDVIHAHLHEGALIGKVLSTLYRVPLVFDFQGSLTSEMIDHNFLQPGSPFFGPLRWLETRINEMADVIITSSHHAANVLIHEFGYPQGKIYPLPDGVNTDRFRARWEVPPKQLEALKLRLGIPLDRVVVVYLGLLAEYQGSSHLLRAAV